MFTPEEVARLRTEFDGDPSGERELRFLDLCEEIDEERARLAVLEESLVRAIFAVTTGRGHEIQARDVSLAAAMALARGAIGR